jgi:hypothetical protein
MQPCLSPFRTVELLTGSPTFLWLLNTCRCWQGQAWMLTPCIGIPSDQYHVDVPPEILHLRNTLFKVIGPVTKAAIHLFLPTL